MQRRSGKKLPTWLKAVIIAGVVVGGAWAIVGGLQYAGLLSIFPVPAEPTAFEITVTDGKTLDSLELDNFDYTLYGTDDLSEWLDFDVIESGSGLGRIADGDLDLADYKYFVTSYNGTVPEDDFDDDLGDRVYYLRWAQLLKGEANQLVALQKPTTARALAISLETLAYINIAGSALNGSVNCTWILGTNGSQPDAAYTYGWNYETNAWNKPRLVLTYNATVTSDIAMSIKGTTRVRVSGTVYSYEFSELGAAALLLDGIWGDDATKFYKVSTAALYYGDTAL
jgi:hypothetical protein